MKPVRAAVRFVVALSDGFVALSDGFIVTHSRDGGYGLSLLSSFSYLFTGISILATFSFGDQRIRDEIVNGLSVSAGICRK